MNISAHNHFGPYHFGPLQFQPIILIQRLDFVTIHTWLHSASSVLIPKDIIRSLLPAANVTPIKLPIFGKTITLITFELQNHMHNDLFYLTLSNLIFAISTGLTGSILHGDVSMMLGFNDNIYHEGNFQKCLILMYFLFWIFVN